MRKPDRVWLLVAAAALSLARPSSALSAPVIDDSPTRVENRPDVTLRRLGTLVPKSVGEISTSRWTVDCAGVDREHADWRSMRDYVVPLGIARIRQQAGWARCEKDPGIYDFAWLDQIVFDAKKMGVSVWMELSYGNPAYPGGGGRQLSAGFPTSPEALAAWDRWVERICRHYKGTVRDWCIWNEPDHNPANTAEFAAEFAIRTAEIVKREIPDARIDTFALLCQNVPYVTPFLKAVRERGKEHLFASVSYHNYCMNPDYGEEDKLTAIEMRKFRAAVKEYASTLRLRQGEAGVQSEWCGAGALRKYRWTELTKGKWALRRAIRDLGEGDDTSVFHLCDLDYRTSGFHDGLLRYGLVKTTGQADGFRVLKVKTAYYAVQNAVSVFNDALEAQVDRTTSVLGGLAEGQIFDWRDVKTGTRLVVFWNGKDVPSNAMGVRDVTVTVAGEPFAAPVWCDVLSGGVYEIPSDRVSRTADGKTIYRVPAYDSPAFVTERALLAFEPTWEDRENGGGK